jgi:phage terminase large subunit-like protein
MRSRVYEFGVACELTEAEINDQSLTHDGNSVLSRHVGNARRHPTRGVVTLRKDSPDSPRKIDAAVAMVGARLTRRTVLASKEWQRRLHRSTGRGRVVALD